jgi:hypothetical protein
MKIKAPKNRMAIIYALIAISVVIAIKIIAIIQIFIIL